MRDESHPQDCELILFGANGTEIMPSRLRIGCNLVATVWTVTVEAAYELDAKHLDGATFELQLPDGALLLDVGVACDGVPLPTEVASPADPAMTLAAVRKRCVLTGAGAGRFTVALPSLGQPCKTLTMHYRHTTLLEWYLDRLVLAFPPWLRADEPSGAQVELEIKLERVPGDWRVSLGNLPWQTSFLPNSLLLRTSNPVALVHDWVLTVQTTAPGSIGLLERDEQGWQALVAVRMPEQSVATAGVARALKIVLDTSDALGDAALGQVIASVAHLLAWLTPDSAFNLVTFDNRELQCFDRARPATRENLVLAQDFLSTITLGPRGRGLDAALEHALDFASDGRLAQTLLVTATPAVDPEALRALALDAEEALFVVLVGNGPQVAQFKRIAAETGGHCVHARTSRDLQHAMARQIKRCLGERAPAPSSLWPVAVTDLSGIPQYQRAVSSNIFAGDTLTYMTAFSENPAGDVQVQFGQTAPVANGQPSRSESVPLQLLEGLELRRLAAARRIELWPGSDSATLAAAHRLPGPYPVGELPTPEHHAQGDRSAVPAAQQGRHEHRAGIVFPRQLGVFQFAGRDDYASRSAGYSVRYTLDEAVIADIFVYGEEHGDLVDGLESEALRREMDKTIRGVLLVLERHGIQKVWAESEGVATCSGTGVAFLWAQHRYHDPRDAGPAGAVARVTETYLCVRGGEFVKIRTTADSPTWARWSREIEVLVHEVAELVGRGRFDGASRNVQS